MEKTYRHKIIGQKFEINTFCNPGNNFFTINMSHF